MSAETDFIEKIAPLVQKYAPKYGIKVCSSIIAQACLESGYGTSDKVYKNGEWRHNYFGLKWRNNRCAISNDYFNEITHEQKSDGSYSQIASPFCKFKSMKDCVIGYFQWTNIKNYSNLKGVTDPQKYLENIKADKYATSIDYVKKNMNVVKKWNLTKYDNIQEEKGSDLMSNSSLVAYTNISSHKSKRTAKIDTITIHCIVGQWTAKKGCDYFATTTRSASANYVVGKNGDIGLSVPEDYRAYTSSNAANDNRAITIETASDTTDPYAITDAAYDALIKLCTDVCKRNGIVKLVWSTNKADRVKHRNGCNMTVHRDFAAKSCPGSYIYSRLGNIADAVNKNLGVVTTSQHAPTVTNKTTSAAPSVPFIIKVLDDDLYIRSTPKYVANNSNVVGHIKDHGKYTIVQVSGGYGKLKSGKGWVSINQKYVKYM